MGSFKRMFAYILPQWPRIIVVVLSVIVVSMLLSLSFMTIIPLMKVMMGKEGLHGWVDRKTCEWQYGVSFYVPDMEDFIQNNEKDFVHELILTGVQKKGLAREAGFARFDRIVGIGTIQAGTQIEKTVSVDLLRELAATGKNEIAVHVRRNSPEQDAVLTLHSPSDKAFIESLDWNIFEKIKWSLKTWVSSQLRYVISFLPRSENQNNKMKDIIFIVAIIGIVTVIRCFAKFCQDYLAEKVVQVGINRLREDAFKHVMYMPIGFFNTERPSDTVSRLIGDTAAMGKAVKIMLGKALREPLNATFFLAAAMLINWQLTVIFIASAPLVLGAVALLGKKMKKASKKSLMAWSQLLAKLQDTMNGLKVVKVYNQQKHEESAFREINNKLLKQLLKISRVDSATMPVLEVLGMGAAFAALIAGVQWVTQNKIEGESFLTLLVFLGCAAEATRKTSDIWNKLQEANAASDRVFALMDQPVEIDKPGAAELPVLKKNIEFRNVLFNYPKTDRPVLKKINLSVKAGHTIALVGPNGSGKTTLANLVPRFYDPNSGSILIDGKDIRDVTLFSLRNQIAMVTQNVVTFNDTIAANIAYGRLDATREQIIDAAKRAYAHEFIAPLPNGYDSMIGEQGTGLSGGQLQRIIIARAILKNPTILIFDEATSQVDADSEAKIHKAIEEMMRERTCFIIAHRFSTIINADVIVVMNDGRIVAQGNHAELSKSCELYQSLYEKQIMAG